MSQGFFLFLLHELHELFGSPSKKGPSGTGNNQCFSMAEDRPGGVDYSGFSFDEKMRVYYSARPYDFACARAAPWQQLPSDPPRPRAQASSFPTSPCTSGCRTAAPTGRQTPSQSANFRSPSPTTSTSGQRPARRRRRALPRRTARCCVCRAARTEGSLPCVRCVVAAS